MKKLKKLLAGVVTLAMAMSMMTMTAFAAPATFDGTATGTLTIHKKAYSGENTYKTPATGEELTAEQLPAGVTSLNGVEFTIYQVVDEAGLDAFYNSNPTALPSINDYVENGAIKSDITVGKTEAITTSGDGVAEFKNLPLGLYVVIETKSPDLVTQPVAPFLVSIPMTKSDGSGWLYSVHVYPKNGTNASGELTLIKKGITIGVADSETTLNNVEFVLQKKNKDTNKWENVTKTTDASGATTDLTLTTADGGKITVSALPDGEYRFIEKEIKADGDKNIGYIKDGATTYDFTVSGGKFTYKDKVNVDTLEIEVINEKPSFEKEIKDKEGNYGTGADYSVGDLIEYKLTVGVPENVAELKTFYIIDKPTNLDDKIDTVQVWDGDTELTGLANVVREGEHGFKITFDATAIEAQAGKKLTLTYKAELLDGALEVIDNGNDAKLVYSTNIVPDNDPENPNNDEDPKVREDEKTAYAYSYKLKVIKKADSETGTPLADVEFDLYKEVTSGGITGDDAKALGLDAGKQWKKVNTSSLKTGADGTITQGGLANGTYYLVETKTNPSYNLLAKPVAVTLQIESTIATKTETKTETAADGTETTTTKTTVTVTHSGAQDDNTQGIWDQTVVNKKGFTLPETGGMGTFVFTFVGIAMMAAAVILFFTSKKKTVK